MNRVLLCFLVFIFFSSCGLREREMELEQKMKQVNQKEQELLLKERSLEIREAELKKKEKRFDTAYKISMDSLRAAYPQLEGRWNVTMRCIETTCPGSAVGDTKSEDWLFTIENNAIIVTAMYDGKIERIYSGKFTGNSIELLAKPENANTENPVKIVVRLQQTKGTEMNGQREIIRPENCRILYTLSLNKHTK